MSMASLEAWKPTQGEDTIGADAMLSGPERPYQPVECGSYIRCPRLQNKKREWASAVSMSRNCETETISLPELAM